jgi:hypothetical protein
MQSLGREVKTFQCASNKANEYKKNIKSMRKAGAAARRKAVWIGYERCTNIFTQRKNIFFNIYHIRVNEEMVEKMKNKVMIENESMYQEHDETHDLTPDDVTFMEYNNFHRICAPNGKAAGTCILWTKDGPLDSNPTWDKVVSTRNTPTKVTR